MIESADQDLGDHMVLLVYPAPTHFHDGAITVVVARAILRFGQNLAIFHRHIARGAVQIGVPQTQPRNGRAIGGASCRESVCQSMLLPLGAVSYKTKT